MMFDDFWNKLADCTDLLMIFGTNFNSWAEFQDPHEENLQSTGHGSSLHPSLSVLFPTCRESQTLTTCRSYRSFSKQVIAVIYHFSSMFIHFLSPISFDEAHKVVHRFSPLASAEQKAKHQEIEAQHSTDSPVCTIHEHSWPWHSTYFPKQIRSALLDSGVCANGTITGHRAGTPFLANKIVDISNM